MKLKKTKSRIFLAIFTIVSLLGSMITSYAGSSYTPSDPQLAFEATRSGDMISVKINAASDFNLGSMQLLQSEETMMDDKTTYQNYSVISTQTQENETYPGDDGITYHAWNETEVMDVTEGQTIFTFNYQCKEPFQKDKDYQFSYLIEEFYYVSGTDYIGYDSEGTIFTVTYREDTEWNVEFMSNGTKIGDTQVIKNGNYPEVPDTPSRSGYTFGGWTTDGTTVVDPANVSITDNTTFVALWNKNNETALNIVDLSSVKVTKTLDADKNVTIPPEEYEFIFTPVKIEPTESRESPTFNTSLTFSDMPALGPIKINTNKTADGTLTDVEFPIGGNYTYKVTEKKGTTEGMKYDTKEYTLILCVEESDGKLELTTVRVELNGVKTEGLEFTNQYSPVDGLAISKTVTGSPKDKTKNFDFSITFKAPAISNGNKPTVGDREIEFDIPYEFTLAHGDILNITNLPEGTTYVLTEKGTEYYTGTITVTGDKNTSINDGEYNSDATVEATIVSGTNTAAFANEYSITPPDTGVLHHNEMPIIFGLFIIAAAGTYVMNRKFRINRG